MPSCAVTPLQTAQTAAAPETLSNLSPVSGSVGSSWRLIAPVAGPCVDLKKGTNPKQFCDRYCQTPTVHRIGITITFRKRKRNGCIRLMSQNCYMLLALDSCVNLSSAQLQDQWHCSNSANLFCLITNTLHLSCLFFFFFWLCISEHHTVVTTTKGHEKLSTINSVVAKLQAASP